MSDFLQQLLRCTSKTLTLSRAGLATQAQLAVDLLQNDRNVILWARDREQALALRSLVILFSSELSCGSTEEPERLFFGDWAFLPPFATRSGHRAGWADRMAVLHALRHGRHEGGNDGGIRLRPVRGLILTLDNVLVRHVPLTFFDGRCLDLVRGEELSPEMVLEQAIDWGYERVSMVANPGDISRRGDILDILPPGMDKPLRLDFFGDVLEDLRVFDQGTQRSLGSLERAVVLPVHPVRQDNASREKLQARWKRLFQKGLLGEAEHFGLTRLLEQRSFHLWPGAAYDASSVLEEWFPKNPVWLLPGHTETTEILEQAEQQLSEQLEDADYRNQPKRLTVRSAHDVFGIWEKQCAVFSEPLRMGIEQHGTELRERPLQHFSDLFPLPEAQDRPWQSLMGLLKTRQKEKRHTLLAFSSVRSRNKFLQLAEQEGLLLDMRYNAQGHGLFALVSRVQGGMELLWNDMLILGESVLQPHAEKARRVPAGAFRGLDKYDDLSVGDLLVHRDHGIGRFGGLLRLDLGGVANDFLLLSYAGDDKLYIPVDRLGMVQRYTGGSEQTPTLDRLGGAAWQAGKDKARKAIERIAEDLVEMYAWRKVAKGFRYGPVGDLYREFEASFSFEETPDQARAIQEVLTDMEKAEPMDRLVCGDVGFGKTEVALRAAFRAASEGRQVALLCPTTVLAEQHYQTFRSRLSGFAVNVGLLSRFVSPAKQKDVLKAAAAGQTDVLIGTHRLLSQDVHLPNLGLLILDEEQRFGVRHKEKLKQLKKNVDALTLTATPIPRTLQLSISGVRELSVIETAPPERKPVSTALTERNDDVLRTVLERELAREGQVFWVHNRVQGLAKVTEYVRQLTPTARVGMAHGQMSEKLLEETMHQFWHGELDVLVCTAIVESGLDFPRANTLVVDQAQMFGLGQLYQLRGRVGRSDRQAFAVFVVPKPEQLPVQARERMRIILDLDYLGAGFQVAMEDLRLRGAGNILGEVQSGHMGRVGLELYLEMLEQAVAKARGEGVALKTETELNLALTAHIPESYIEEAQERLGWYKMLSSAPNSAARQEMELELLDRYGKPPLELQTFLAVLELKDLLSEAQVLRADIFADRVKVTWSEKQTAVPPNNLLQFLAEHKTIARFAPPAVLECRLDTSLEIPERLGAIRRMLNSLLPNATM